MNDKNTSAARRSAARRSAARRSAARTMLESMVLTLAAKKGLV